MSGSESYTIEAAQHSVQQLSNCLVSLRVFTCACGQVQAGSFLSSSQFLQCSVILSRLVVEPVETQQRGLLKLLAGSQGITSAIVTEL